MSEQVAWVDQFEWDATTQIEATAQSIYTHGGASDTPWEQVPEETREEWRELATDVLAEILPPIVADVTRKYAAFLGRHIEILETRSEKTTGDDE